MRRLGGHLFILAVLVSALSGEPVTEQHGIALLIALALYISKYTEHEA